MSRAPELIPPLQCQTCTFYSKCDRCAPQFWNIVILNKHRRSRHFAEGDFSTTGFMSKRKEEKQGFLKTLIRVRSKLMGYQLALMFNQVEIGYQQPALLRLFKFPHRAIIHLHSDCIARRRVAVWSGGNLCVTKSHLISCRLARPMQIPYTLVFTIVHTQTHTETRICICTCTQIAATAAN